MLGENAYRRVRETAYHHLIRSANKLNDAVVVAVVIKTAHRRLLDHFCVPYALVSGALVMQADFDSISNHWTVVYRTIID